MGAKSSGLQSPDPQRAHGVLTDSGALSATYNPLAAPGFDVLHNFPTHGHLGFGNQDSQQGHVQPGNFAGEM